jgi:hypothetical protein
VLGRNVSGKSFVADRRINERRGERGEKGKAKGAKSATLFVLVRFRRVPVALASRRFCFHFRAAVRLPAFRRRSLAWNRGKGDRRSDRHADEKSEGHSHGATILAAELVRFNVQVCYRNQGEIGATKGNANVTSSDPFHPTKTGAQSSILPRKKTR